MIASPGAAATPPSTDAAGGACRPRDASRLPSRAVARDVGDHHHTVGEQPAVSRRDRHRHGQTCTVEAYEELGLPREISVAPDTATTRPRGAR